jgi:hypothetical protein
MHAVMLAKSNKVARQLSSTPQTHRTSTLAAISQKAHDVTARIEHLKIEVKRMKDLSAQAPGQGQSRIDWIHNQLQSN